MLYKPLCVKLLSWHGLQESMSAMRLPKNNSVSDSTDMELGPQDARLATRLILAGNDHAKALRGIFVWLQLEMQTGWMIEFETYRHGIECLSTSSSMHNELHQLKGTELAEQKQRDLPEKVYTRIVVMSYQALRSIYCARRHHRHPDWQIFCEFLETLPYFRELIYPEASHKKQEETQEASRGIFGQIFRWCLWKQL